VCGGRGREGWEIWESKRPHKEPFTHDRARNIIVDGQGTHFDPRVVESFLICEQEFIEIHETYRAA